MISPTGKGIRGVDKHGSGEYGASRGKRHHSGADFVCDPGQDVVAPVSGIIVREARPYAEGPYSGLVMRNSALQIKMFYFLPHDVTPRHVNQGDIIGIAQDISEKYPGIIPHVHLQVDSIDPQMLLKNTWWKIREVIDQWESLAN